MIVCAAPRSGGTIFCIELARELGIRFEGELNILHADEIRQHSPLQKKSAAHETHFQPDYNLSEFFGHAQRVFSQDHLYLINHQVAMFLPHAEAILVRRDARAALMSMADLFLRGHQADPAKNNRIRQWLKILLSEQAKTFWFIKLYCQTRGLTPIFFEDRFESKKAYTALESSPERAIIHELIEGYLERWGLNKGF
jgi:hypothetical protein